MDLSSEIASNLTIFLKYAKYLPYLQRRENWDEIVDRYADMHIKKFPALADEIRAACQFIRDKKVLPSMRQLQFGGKPIELSPNRGYNCCATPIDSWEAFGEVMFLLLGGSGVGFSVQRHHVAKLPVIKGVTKRTKRYLINDSIEGWADAVKILVRAYFFGESNPELDFSDIREKGALLKTSGGRAPGPQPLKDCIHNLRKIFDTKQPGDKLTPLEVHDCICFIADAVLAGGIRRAALLSLFSMDDEEMLTCKFGNWAELNPQRGRANNSAVILRHKIKKPEFITFWNKIKASGTGEPGIFFSNDSEYLCNPCEPAWATLLTPNGITTMGEIKVGDTIWSGKQWTKVTAKAMTGIKPVYAYTTHGGTFYGTENHRIVTKDNKVEVKDAESIDLCVGPGSTIEHDIQDIMDGLVIGDGSVHKASNNLVYLIIGNKDQDYRQSEIKSLLLDFRPGLSSFAWEISTTINSGELPKTYDRQVPERFRVNASLSKMAGFLRGLYSANGSIVANRITLKAASLQIILQAQTMLSALGIHSYYTTNKAHDVKFNNGTYTCKESYDLNISTDREVFRKTIGFLQKYKQEKLDIICNEIISNKIKTNYDIVSRELLGEETVYDITVEADEHTYWTDGLLVSNCAEISLRSNQMCNLTTTNVSDVKDQKDLNDRVRVASFLGTLQASYTDFHYLRDIWRETTEKEALLGVSMTGIASSNVLKLDLTEAAEVVKVENKRVAKLIKINPAARQTALKPEGTGSLVLGTSSGIHAWHADRYIRRIRILKNEAIYKYLKDKLPELIEDDFYKPHLQAVISLPIKAPDKAITREESVFDLLERVKKFNKEWVQPGHIKGNNTHNISATISVKDKEWEEVGEWMWKNRDSYNGLSVLPFDGGNYPQLPFEECDDSTYKKMMKYLEAINLDEVVEISDATDLQGEAACAAGGSCEIK